MVPNDGLNNSGFYRSKISTVADDKCEVNIFHKHITPEETVSQALFSSDVTKVMFDVCDDHFDRGHGDYYKQMCDIAHVLTCNTANMQTRIYDVTGRLAQICRDPITFPRYDFVYATNPQVVWYGHALNVFSIVPYIGKIPNLSIITNAKLPSSDKVRAKFWKPDLVEETIPMYDIVVIPKIHTNEARMKSPNRAVDALHAGRFVIAESEEVYGELHNFIFLGSIEEGLQFYRDNPEGVRLMVELGQQYVIEKYNHKAVTEDWIKAIEHEDYSKYDR